MLLCFFSAGQAEGIEVWNSRTSDDTNVASIDKFQPRLTSEERDVMFERWKDGVERSLGWAKKASSTATAASAMTLATNRMFASVAPSVFLFTSFLMWKIADWMEEPVQ
jgi:hypothetical protein